MTIHFLSINAKGLNHPAKRKSLWTEALLHDSDIVCVQETNFSAAALPKCTHKKYPFITTANANSKTKRVLMAIRDSIAFNIHKEIKDPNSRFLILTCDLNSTTYTIVTVNSPNKRQIHFFNKLMKKVITHLQGLLIICGDLNTIPDPEMDSTS